MRIRLLRRMLLGVALVGGASVLAEPAVRADQVAAADKWTYHVSNLGDYCADCCPPRFLCCDIPEVCGGG